MSIAQFQKITPEKALEQFQTLVLRMRQAQKSYDKSATYERLRLRLLAEAAVDKELEKVVVEKETIQSKLL